MNKILLLSFVIVASCYPKPTQSEPIALVEALPDEVVIEFIPEGE
jgi:hypothetical protein